MASAATLAALCSGARDLAVLMVLSLTQADGGVTTLHLATSACTAPDGTPYFAAIADPSVVSQTGSYLGYDVNLCTSNPTLIAEAPVTGSRTVKDLYCGDYVWLGSYVEMYVWDKTTDEPVQTFRGTVQGAEMDGGVLRLSLRQRIDWNAPVASVAATREKYPNLPDDSVGAGIARRWGRFQNSPCRPPAYPSDYPLSNALERIRGARRAVAGLLVEPGRGDGAATVLFSSHRLHTFGTQASATSPFIEQGDSLDPLVGCTAFNDDNGAGIYLPDDSAVGRCPILPDAFKEVETYTPVVADNHAALYDPWNDQSYCRVQAMRDQFSRVVFRLAAVPEDVTNGGITAATLLVVARCNALSNFGVSFVKYSDLSGFSNNAVVLGPANSTHDSDDFELFTLDCTAFVTGGNASVLSDMGVSVGQYVSGSYFGRGWADIAAVALELRYKPRQEKMGAERHVLVTKQRPTLRLGAATIGGGTYDVWDTLPPEQEVRGKFYANLIGYADDGSGTYTGAAGAPIERPCDIARHLLIAVGGQSAAQVESAAGELGSFVDARALSKTFRGGDMVLAAQVDDDTDLMTLLARIASNGVASIQLDPFTDKWRYIPWLADPAVTRTKPISRTQFLGVPRVLLSDQSKVSVNVRVPYGYDEATGSYLHQVNLSPSGSCAGWKYLNQNDQSIATVAGASDRMDFLICPSSGAATYSAGNLTVTRASGSFLTDDSFYLGALVWSDRPGIVDGTTITGFGGSPYGNTMTLSAAPTISTGSWPAMLALLGSVTLSAGDLSMDAWMDALQSALRTSPLTFMRRRWAFAFGGHPRWRCNTIYYRDEGVVRGVGLTPPNTADDSINSMESVAAALQDNMNASGSTGWVVTYSRTTHRFTIHNPTRHFQLLFGSGDGGSTWMNYNGCCSLGFPPIDQDDTANPDPAARNHTYTSTVPIEEGQFVLGCDVGFIIRWRNGPNGQIYNTVPKTPYSALGFSPHDDTAPWWVIVTGSVLKGLRQKAMSRASQRYLRTTGDGPSRKAQTIEGRDIFDTDTALEVRNRVGDLLSRPHVIVQGTADGLFGLRRGEVVTFDDDMSDVSRYCAPDSDSLWAGKKFYIIEAHQRQGPDSLAVELTAVSV